MPRTIQPRITLTQDELADALREAAQAHHRYEATLGGPDKEWAEWYAYWIVKQRTVEDQGAACD
jgi:hypothetical protein